ncbi:MAG: oligosaccharide flippase family protein [Nostocales cyanobacterium 94392]|nr:oligosaccharide flippase family protein [Nostocales cyanobacterium 94392]
MTSVKKLAIRGAIWTFAGYGASQVLRFGSNLILTRLLVPEYFGLMAVVNTLRMGIELFSDIGISPSLINNKNADEPSFQNTAWTLQVIRGFALWLFCLLISFPAANFYNDSRFLWLIPLVGLYSVFDGFTSTAIFTCQRRIDLARFTIFDLAVQILSLLTMIIWAWFNPNLLALAMGVVIAGVYRMVGSFWLIPGYTNRFAWDKSAFKEILSFGKWMFISSALMFASEQSDRLILGKLLSFEILGVYTVAYTLASIPKEVIKKLSYRVIFPTISTQVDLPRSSLRDKILRQRGTMLMGFAIGLAALTTVGDLIIAKLYDSRYAEATWMMPILCSGIWFSLLFYTVSPALLAISKPLYSAQSNLARFVMIGIVLPLGFFRFGILGAIIVIALSDLPLYIVNLYGLWREKLCCIRQDIQVTALFVGVLTLFIFIRYFLGFGLPIDSIL